MKMGEPEVNDRKSTDFKQAKGNSKFSNEKYERVVTQKRPNETKKRPRVGLSIPNKHHREKETIFLRDFVRVKNMRKKNRKAHVKAITTNEETESEELSIKTSKSSSSDNNGSSNESTDVY